MSTHPWDNIQAYIPSDFSLSDQGVYLIKQDPVLISGPCWISALTKSKEQREWGRQILFMDHDGNEQSLAFPAQRLLERAAPLASDLAAAGLMIIPGKQNLLMQYLGSFKLPESFRRSYVTKLGWLDCKEEDPPRYLTPEKVFGMGESEPVVFQPEAHSATLKSMHSRGSLEQWQTFVAIAVKKHPILLFSLSVAFAGPLLKPTGMECGGFHLYGASSKGKTTALQVAASVWGSGADPSNQGDSYINKWHSTGNAFEATASAHNDNLLCLDEMGTCDQADFGKVVYDLFGGRGKVRMNKNSAVQAVRDWRIMGLSTGEISVAQKIEEEKGSKAKTGQLVRLVDIPIQNGVLDLDTAHDPQKLINELKKYCERFHGTAGPAFLHHLTHLKPDLRSLKQTVSELVEDLLPAISPPGNLEPSQQRVLERFALVAAAGWLACEFGILPMKETQVVDAVSVAVRSWFYDHSNLPPTILGLLAVREFILREGARIRAANDDRPIHKLIGYERYISGEKLFLLTDSGFNEATAGFDAKSVAKELRGKNYLKVHERHKLKSKHTVTESGKRISVYAIRESFLEFDGVQNVHHTAGAGGATGAGPMDSIT